MHIKNDTIKYFKNYYSCNNSLECLSREECINLVTLAQAGDSDSQNRIVDSCLRFIIKIANEFCNDRIDFEDLIQVGVIGCINAINTFNPYYDYAFLTYCNKVIRNEMLQYIRKLKLEKTVLLVDCNYDDYDHIIPYQFKDESIHVEELVEDRCTINQLLIEIKKLPKDMQEILECTFGINGKTIKTQEELARIFNISQSYVSRKINRALKEIQIKLEL